MSKFVSPLLGYNNNVRHKNRVFHIQTEDSGVNHPHIITHLFMDGGRILKSVKTSYAEHVGNEKMNETVRGMMKEQHKAMFIALRDGQFDHLVDGGAPKAKTGEVAAKPSEPTVAASPATADAAAKTNDALATATEAPRTVPEPDAAAADATAGSPAEPGAAEPPPAALAAVPAPEPTTPELADDDDDTVADAAAAAAVAPAAVISSDLLAPGIEGPFRAAASAAPAAPSASTTRLGIAVPAPSAYGAAAKGPVADPAPSAAAALAQTTSSPSGTAKKPSSVRDLTLDFDALDAREPSSPKESPRLFRENDLPPPPPNLFARGGVAPSAPYRSSVGPGRRADPREEAEDRAATGPRPAAKPSPSGSPARPASAAPSSGARAPDQRYAPARPATIFGANATANRPPSTSIFSDELISDKSLDEVILSYLAEDLEPPRRK